MASSSAGRLAKSIVDCDHYKILRQAGNPKKCEKKSELLFSDISELAHKLAPADITWLASRQDRARREPIQAVKQVCGRRQGTAPTVVRCPNHRCFTP